MIKGQRNNFIGGLNKDVSEELVDASRYRDARNGRLVSLAGNTAEYQNLKGDTLAFSLPALPKVYEESYVAAPDATGPYGIDLQYQAITWDSTTNTYTYGIVTTVLYSETTILELINTINASGIFLIEFICNNTVIKVKSANPTAYYFVTQNGDTGLNISATFDELYRTEVSDLRIIGSGSDEKSLILFTTSNANDLEKYITYINVPAPNPAGGSYIVSNVTYLGTPGVGPLLPAATSRTDATTTIADYFTNITPMGMEEYVSFEALVDIGTGIYQIRVVVDKAWSDENYPGTTSFAWTEDTNTAFGVSLSPNPAVYSTKLDGQIWELDITDGLQPTNLGPAPTYYLDPTVHLIYYDKLNFLLRHQIYDAELVRESNSIARVYWTDNLNEPRVLRISDGYKSDNISTLSISPFLQLGQIGVTQVKGGNLKQGIYQFAYRLLTEDGAQSNFSYLSPLLPIIQDTTNNWREHVGITIGNSSDCSALVQVSGVDQSYDSIELAALYYTTEEGNPEQVWIAAREKIASEAILILVSDNDETFDPVSVAEVSLQNPFIATAKSLKVNEDRLYLANITEGITDLTIDISSVVLGETFSRFPADVHANYNVSSQYVFDGGDPNWIGTNRSTGPSGVDSVGSTISLTNDFPDYKGWGRNFYRRGYLPGEVYRFGIVFFLKDGSTSKVQWLDDYQFQHRRRHDATCVATGNVANTNDMGTAQFNLEDYGLYVTGIDVSGIKDDIIGFSIVRAARDKRLLFQGYAVPLLEYTIERAATLDFTYYDTEYFDLVAANDILSPPFGGWISRRASLVLLDVCALYAPELSIEPSLIEQASYIEHYGFCTDRNTGSYIGLQAYNVADPIFRISKMYMQSGGPTTIASLNATGLAKPGLQRNIDYYRIVERNALAFNDTSLYAGNSFSLGIGDQSLERKGQNEETVLIKLEADFPLPLRGPTSSLLYPDPGGGGTDTNALAIVNVYNNKQINDLYGGQSDDALEQTEYYFCGHYQPVDDCNKGSNYVYTAKVFGGDCFTVAWASRHRYNARTSSGGLIYDNNTAGAAPTNPQVQPYTSYNSAGVATPITLFSEMAAAGGNGVVVPLQSTINATQIYGNTLDGPTLTEPNPDFALSTTLSVPPTIEGVWNRDLAATKAYIGGAGIGREANDLVNVIQASQRKINGERVDKFRLFPVNERAEWEYGLGEINHIDTLYAINSGNALYVWTPLSFGAVPINERVVIGTASEAVIGSGTLFGNPQYISRNVGTWHKGSVVKSDRAFYWWDLNNREAFRFAADGVTALGKDKGMSTYLNDTGIYGIGGLLIDNIGVRDNAILLGGVHGAYNQEYGEYLMTAIDQGLFGVTLVYSDAISAFSSIYTEIVPQQYITVWGERMYSPKPQTQPDAVADIAYLHFSNPVYNVFYGGDTAAYTEIQFVVNDDLYETKVLSHMLMTGNRLWTDYEILSGEQQRWDEGVVRHETYGLLADTAQPRGKRWQSPINRIVGSYEENPDGTSAGAITTYTTGKMRGGYFLIKLRTNATTLRGLLEVMTMFNVSKRNR